MNVNISAPCPPPGLCRDKRAVLKGSVVFAVNASGVLNQCVCTTGQYQYHRQKVVKKRHK